MSSKGESREVAGRTSKRHSEESEGEVKYPEKVVLRSNDGEEFETEVNVAMQSDLIKNAIGEGCTGCIPLRNLSGDVLTKVIEYWKRRAVEAQCSAEITEAEKANLKEFDKKFVDVDVDDTTLVQLVTAVHYLSCKPLLDTTSQAIANMIKGHTVQQIREFFAIKNDFTQEEEERIVCIVGLR